MNTTTILSALAPGASMQDAVAGIKGYKFGDSTAPLRNVENMVYDSLGDANARKSLASALAALLASDATKDAKLFACRQLALCGGADNVPALAPLLTSIETSHAARIALERIPGAEADAALLDALGKADAKSKIGIVNSLGARKTTSAIPAIAPLLSSSDPQLADSAAAALGHIGGPDAVKALQGRVAKTARDTAANALLECAEHAADVKTAAKIYHSVSGSKPVARAARLGLEKTKGA